MIGFERELERSLKEDANSSAGNNANNGDSPSLELFKGKFRLHLAEA